MPLSEQTTALLSHCSRRLIDEKVAYRYDRPGAASTPDYERPRQSLVAVHLDDVIDAALERDLGGAIGRAVIDEPLDLVEAFDFPRQIRQGLGES